MIAFVTPFSRLGRWDPGFNAHPGAQWAGEPTALGELVARRRERVDRKAHGDAPIPLATIHFDGTMSPRPEGGHDLAGALFWAYAGDLVFSKIDARNGAIGIVPPDMPRVAFTAEYPIYRARTDADLVPGFLRLVLRSEVIRRRLGALAGGHSGRRRVDPAAVERLELPRPAPDEQRAILRAYEERVAEAATAEAEAEAAEGGAAMQFLEDLGVTAVPFERVAGPFTTPFRTLDRWSVTKAMYVARGITGEVVSQYPVRRLGDPGLGEVSYGIQKSPRNRPGPNARPYLRVANVQDGRLDLSELKYIEVTAAQLESLRLEPGDLLLCEGNSEALVGRPALWRGEVADCVHQNHVLKVRVNRDVLDPEYVLAYMGTAPARQYFAMRVTRTTNLATINATDVAEMPIPVPPIPVQRRLAGAAVAARDRANEQRAAGARLRRGAHDDVDAALGGGRANAGFTG